MVCLITQLMEEAGGNAPVGKGVCRGHRVNGSPLWDDRAGQDQLKDLWRPGAVSGGERSGSRRRFVTLLICMNSPFSSVLRFK